MRARRVAFAAVVLLGALAVLGTTATAQTGTCTQLGVLEGEAGPELAGQDGLTPDAAYHSDVYHCEDVEGSELFKRGSASIGPGGLVADEPRGRVELSEFFLHETAWVFYHERGHNLGFEHSGGIMDYDKPDADPDTPIAYETKVIANNTEGLHYVNWRSDDSDEFVEFVVGEWLVGNTSDEAVRYGISRWLEGTSDDVYADNTIVAKFDEQLPVYDDSTPDREVLSNAFYRNHSVQSGEAWR